jgi:glucose-1-phosphate thymidylyltransferase
MVSKAVLLARGGRDDLTAGQLGLPRPSARRPSLLPLANRALVLHALDALDDAGITDVAVVSEPGVAAQVEAEVGVNSDWRFRLTCFEQDLPNGFGTALSLVEDFINDEPFVLHLGDSLSKRGLGPLIDSAPIDNLDALVLVRQAPEHATVFDLDVKRRAGVVGRPQLFRRLEPAGVCVFGARTVEVARHACPATAGELEVTDTLEQMAAMGGRVQLRPVEEWWRYHAQTDVLLEGNRFVLESLTTQTEGALLENTLLQGTVAIHPTAQLRSSVIRGPAIIGAGARLSEAFVGPFTSIAEGVTIEGAEVEDSIIFAGSSINHLSGRIESSVVGPRARIFRDFRLPKALRLDLGECAEISLP